MEPFFDGTLPDFVFKMRTYQCMSSKDLGDMVGVSASFITGIERGVQFPSRATAEAIFTALDVKYEAIDNFTLQISTGEKFTFKYSTKGRGSRKFPRGKIPLSDSEILTRRIEALEERIVKLEEIINATRSTEV